ncbi:MAG: hypothetical protein WAQ99_10800 [Pyrinomonadaceae bacterium]
MNKLVYKMEVLKGPSELITGLDYFILASGSDYRAYQVLANLDTSSTKVIVINFNERLLNKAPGDDLFNYKKLQVKDVQDIYCAIQNPDSCLSGLQANTFEDSSKIGIDISCFTKPYFYYLIKLFSQRFLVSKLTTYYTEPKSYLFSNGLFNTFRTSTGPLSITEIPGYSGQGSRDSKRILIILLGFDGDLSKEINEDVGPEETIVVNGFPSYVPKFKDVSLIANEKLIDDHRVKVRFARANNPFDVYNLLEQIRLKDGMSFMNVAPLGTKPMALGACLFALHNPDVRVVYPLPNKYEDKYSDASWNSWAYELPLVIQ